MISYVLAAATGGVATLAIEHYKTTIDLGRRVYHGIADIIRRIRK